MVLTQTRERNPVQLRLWPGVVSVLLQWFIRFGVPAVVPEALGYGVLGELVFGLAVLVWWLFFSRAPRSERWGAFVLMIAALLVTRRILHVSIATGMMGLMFVLYSIPVVSLAIVASPADLDARPWWRPFCLPAGSGHCCAPRASPPKPIPSSPGVGRRLPSRSCWIGPAPKLPRDPRYRSKKRYPRNGARPDPASSLRRPRPPFGRHYRRLSHPPGPHSGPSPTGPAFADLTAMASFLACGSRPTGLPRRRSSYGAGRSDRAGRPSLSATASSTRRSNAAISQSSPATVRPLVSRCGLTATPPVSGSRMPAPVLAARRPSATDAYIPLARRES